MQTDYRDELWPQIFFSGRNILSKKDKLNISFTNRSMRNSIVERDFNYTNHLVTSFLSVFGLIDLKDKYQLDVIENCQNLFEVESELLLKVGDISVVIQTVCDDDLIKNIKSNTCIDIFPKVFREAVSKLRTSEEIELDIQKATAKIKKYSESSLDDYKAIINSLLVNGQFERACELLKAQDLEPIIDKITPYSQVFTQINAPFLDEVQRRKVIRRVFQVALKNNDWKTVKEIVDALSIRVRPSLSNFISSPITHKPAIYSFMYRLKDESIKAGNVNMVIALNKVLRGEEGSIQVQIQEKEAAELVALKIPDYEYRKEVRDLLQKKDWDSAFKKASFIKDATIKDEALSKIYFTIEGEVYSENFDCSDDEHVTEAVNLISYLPKGNIRCLCLNQIAIRVFPKMDEMDVMSSLYAADEIENLDEFKSVLIKFFKGVPVSLKRPVAKVTEDLIEDYYQYSDEGDVEYLF